jgi:hypothetical protein
MKKLFLVLLVAIMVIPTFQSCKKGANDPTISLRSRKSRLVGEWTLSEGSYTYTQPGGSATYVFNGSTQVTTVSGLAPYSAVYTQKVTIDKDGSYKNEINDDGDFSTQEGGWFFGDKNKELDLKNKEIVCFAEKKYTSGSNFSEYTGLWAISSPNVWKIDQLKNKEIIVILDATETDSNGDIYTQTGTLTYTQK